MDRRAQWIVSIDDDEVVAKCSHCGNRVVVKRNEYVLTNLCQLIQRKNFCCYCGFIMNKNELMYLYEKLKG